MHESHDLVYNQKSDIELDIDSVPDSENLKAQSIFKKNSNGRNEKRTHESSSQDDNGNNVPKVKKTSTSRQYTPDFRSGAYALLITLLNHENEMVELKLKKNYYYFHLSLIAEI